MYDRSNHPFPARVVGAIQMVGYLGSIVLHNDISCPPGSSVTLKNANGTSNAVACPDYNK